MKNKLTIVNIPIWVCDFYLYMLSKSHKFKNKSLGLEDANLTNLWYASKRSNMYYIYLSHWATRLMNRALITYLWFKTGVKFNGSLNGQCSPINMYSKGCSIECHRDRDMLTNEYVEYIAALTLENCDEGGEFYYNYPNNVSDYGKYVERDIVFDVVVPNKKGQITILYNRSTVHGTLPVISGQRMSLGFRSK